MREAAEHRFRAGMRVFGLKEGGVDYVHEGPHAAGIPDDVKQKVEPLRAAVVRGDVRVPAR